MFYARAQTRGSTARNTCSRRLRIEHPHDSLQVFREGTGTGSSDEDEQLNGFETERQHDLERSELLDMGNGSMDLLAASGAFCTGVDREAEFDEADILAVQAGPPDRFPRKAQVDVLPSSRPAGTIQLLYATAGMSPPKTRAHESCCVCRSLTAVTTSVA